MGNLVAIVGRPNVGKSTLFNRLTKTRQAIVNEEAGTTRDRQYGKSEWLGREFSVVDTGGWVVNSDDVFEEEIRKQVLMAVDEADVILFVVDVMNGVTDLDMQVASILRRAKKPVLLIANSLHLDADANTEHIIQSILKLSPESRVHPTQSNTQAWQSIICRAKQTMGFILYFCTLLSSFACGALFWVIGLQHQKQFSVLFALGMTPGRIRGMILPMAGMIGTVGVTIGIPLAVLAISRREAIRQALSAIGIDAFPTDVLDMALPAHAPLPLYITHSLISLAFIFIAALPTLLSLPRLARQMPRS